MISFTNLISRLYAQILWYGEQRRHVLANQRGSMTVEAIVLVLVAVLAAVVFKDTLITAINDIWSRIWSQITTQL